MDLCALSAMELATLMRSGEVSVKEALQATIDRIEETKEYNCYITTAYEEAWKRAEYVQKQLDEGGHKSPLAGVPIAVKDNLCTKGILTTCGSKMLSQFVPNYSATAVECLEKAGAILVGKTNMDEFAMGSTTETSYFGATKNPIKSEYVPGGSSGGSAAAVALGSSFAALGTDTGGSIRQPASHCGVVGIKPTYGTVSRFGLVSYASSMDQIGPLTKNVTDAAAMLEMIAVYDKRDATAIKRGDTDFTSACVEGVKGMRIGIPREYFEEGVMPQVKEAVLNGVKQLEHLGARVEWFDFQLMQYLVPTYYTIASAEASSNLERYDGVKYGYRAVGEDANKLHPMYKRTRSEGFGGEVKRRIMLGTFVLSADLYDAYYLKALRVKNLIKQSFDQAFEKYDLIVGPVAPTTAPKLGESLTDAMKMYLSDVYTVSANLLGLPAISVPCGNDENGLPIGMQFIGNLFQEKRLIQAAYNYEQSRKERG